MPETDPSPLVAHGLADEIARIVSPELWGNPFSYPDHVHSDDTLKAAREVALHKANRIAALRSSQPDTREGFAAGIEAAAKVAEGWTSSLVPGNMERYYGHNEAARSIAAAIRALEAHRAAKETTDG